MCVCVFAGLLRLSVCLAAVFLILGVDVLEDKGPIELRPANDARRSVSLMWKDGVRVRGLFPLPPSLFAPCSLAHRRQKKRRIYL